MVLIAARSLVNKPRSTQAAVLVAGVTFNIILAWLLITLGFVHGLPAAVGDFKVGKIENVNLTITNVLPNSPAAKAHLKPGDIIVALGSGKDSVEVPTVEQTQNFLALHGGKPVTIQYLSSGKESAKTVVTPIGGLVTGKAAIGISLDEVGLLKVPLWQAWWEGLLFTGSLILSTIVGLWHFLALIVTGSGGTALSQVTGPVGLVGLVGDARTLGLSYLLSFTALISINLAVINMIPFPALDGGRLLFLAVEAIKGSRINPKVTNMVNMVGFALLIILMLAVTYSDIGRLFLK
jgi:regulator of sigma E protease